MEWLIPIAIIVIYLYIRSKRPSSRFWRCAAKYPEAAYQWFNSEECWHVGESQPSGDWSGPYRLFVPSAQKVIKIYGRLPELEDSQLQFLIRVKEHENKNS